ARLSTLSEDLKAAIDADAESYNSVMKAYKDAKANPDGSEQKIERAMQGAAAVPLSVAQKAREVGKLAESLKPITNPNMASDLLVAGALSRAAVEGAVANVEINLASIKDAKFI